MAFRREWGKQNRRSTLFLSFLIVLFLALIVFIIINIKIDRFSELLKMERATTLLVVITGEHDKPVITSVLFYNPNTYKAALLNIPEHTGSIILQDEINRIDRIDLLYKKDSPEPYMQKISTMMDVNCDFYLILSLKQLSNLVDMMNGLPIFIPKPVDVEQNGQRLLIPPGSVVLDGSKVVSYIKYLSGLKNTDEQVHKEQLFLQALMKRFSTRSADLFQRDFFNLLYSYFQTDFDKKSLHTLMGELQRVDMDRLIFQTVRGTTRTIEDKTLLFPFHEGKILVQTVKQIQDVLSRSDFNVKEDLVISLEILNGTNRTGLASRTAQLYKSYGYNIVSVNNADRNDYENSVFIDRTGSLNAAEKAADLINCLEIHSQPDSDYNELVDVTIILGKDFDGRYVK